MAAGLLGLCLGPLPGTLAGADTGLPGALPAECAGLPPELHAEVLAWRAPGSEVGAGRDAAAAPAIRPGQRYRVALAPTADVGWVIAPAREPKAADLGGILALDAPKPGEYRVILGERAWIEVLDADSRKPAAAARSDRRLGCAGIGKNLSFELAAAGRHWIQISGSAAGAIDLMVHALSR